MKKFARLRVPQETGADISSSNNGHNSSSEAQQQGVRTTGRIKKPKAVFDPSDNYLPRSQRVTPSGVSGQTTHSLATPPAPVAGSSNNTRRSRSGSFSNNNIIELANGDFCYVCCKKDQRRGYGKYRMIACLGCEKKAHRTCLKMEFEDLETLRKNFMCEECRICEVCKGHDPNASKPNDFVICARCCKLYHANCHVPMIKKVQTLSNDWKCSKCVDVLTSTTASPSVSSSDNDASYSSAALPAEVIREIIGDESLKTVSTLQPSIVEPVQQPEQAEAPPKRTPQLNTASAAANSQSLAQKRHTDTKEENQEGTTRRPAKSPMTNGALTIIVNGHGPSAVSASSAIAPKMPHTASKVHQHSKQSRDDKHQKVAAPICRPIKMEIPTRNEVQTWSFDKVADYFSKHFPQEAYVFRDQEIDGNALLLLSRSDVVKKLPIKLGPSLHIYQHILRIQKQVQDDPTIGWECGNAMNFSSSNGK